MTAQQPGMVKARFRRSLDKTEQAFRQFEQVRAMIGSCRWRWSMCHLFRSVLRDAKGSTAVLAAMAFPVILAGAAAAVTYSGVVSTRASYQNALDGAVLAATILPTTATT